MAGYSIEVVEEKLRLEGIDREVRLQEEKVKEAIIDLQASAVGVTVTESLDKVRMHRGTIWDAVAEGVDCGKGFSADFQDLTALLMRAFGDFSLLGSLQGLLDNLNIFPPGFGFPSFDFDFDWPSLDFGLSLGGGWDLSNLFDFGDMLNFDGFRLPGCDTVSSDKFVSPLAENNYLKSLNQPEKFISKFHEQTEVALNLDTATTTLGKTIIKTKTDEKGNPFYEAFSRGETCVSPRFNCIDEKKIGKAIVEFKPAINNSAHLGENTISLTQTIDPNTGKSHQLETTPDPGGYYHDNKPKTETNSLADNSGFATNRLEKNTAQFSNIQHLNAGANAPNRVDHSTDQNIEFNQKGQPSTNDQLNPFFNHAQLAEVTTPFGERDSNKRDLDPNMYGQPGNGLHQYEPDANINTSSGRDPTIMEFGNNKGTSKDVSTDGYNIGTPPPEESEEIESSELRPKTELGGTEGGLKATPDKGGYYHSTTSKSPIADNSGFATNRLEKNTLLQQTDPAPPGDLSKNIKYNLDDPPPKPIQKEQYKSPPTGEQPRNFPSGKERKTINDFPDYDSWTKYLDTLTPTEALMVQHAM